jgi:hypothetical protein
VFFALVYLVLRRLLQLFAGSSNELMDTEVELVILRHQLKIRRIGSFSALHASTGS